ncbi:MAG: hypothetical protein JWP22_3213 [Ramlibacter sp.]|nr:hypothetical protein [Ramlibacter sp.]
MRRAALFGALLICASLSLARGLDDGDRIDAVFVHAQTGQPALLLSVDKPVEGSVVEKQLDYKLGTYIGFVRSGDLYAKYPKAKREPNPLLIILFEDQPSTRVREMTFRARDRLVSMGFEVQLKVYDETSKKNVDLAP